MALIPCPECKKQVSDQAKSCPNCGIRLKSGKNNEAASARRITAIVTLVIVAIVGVLVAVWLSGSGVFGKSLNDAYDEYCKGKTSSATFTCKLGDKGKSLMIDTNPQDRDGGSSTEGSRVVRNINKYMGFPEILDEMIGNTSSLDGRITKEYNGYEITWKYHPDSGLEIIYTKK